MTPKGDYLFISGSKLGAEFLVRVLWMLTFEVLAYLSETQAKISQREIPPGNGWLFGLYNLQRVALPFKLLEPPWTLNFPSVRVPLLTRAGFAGKGAESPSHGNSHKAMFRCIIQGSLPF